MTERINTELNLDLQMKGSVAEVKELSKGITESVKELQHFQEIGSSLKQMFKDVGSEVKALTGLLKSAGQGTIGSAINRTALTQQRNEQRGSDQGVALAIAKDELSIRRQMAQVGEKIVESYRIESKIKQGINDISTLQYQREIALSKIAQISLGNETNKKKLLGEQAVILQNLETGIKSMENLEKNRIKYQKEQEVQRKKEIADAQKLLDLETKRQTKAAKEKGVDSEGKPLATAAGSNIITAINRKSMSELLIVQTKLLLNYQLIGSALSAFQFGVTYVRDLDKAFHELRAIGDLTETQMKTLSTSIIEVANNSKFTAVEVAQSAVTLAQAGYSGDEIKSSIQAITLLATAAGTDLKQAVDVVTSVINVFGYQVNQSTQIANVMTAALNESKLSMEQLGLGIQYASNIAADANISFGEMIASFGVLADAGIRSGSTIGTGYRQLINDLQNPTERLKTRLSELGLGMDAIDIKSKGLAGIIKTLASAGYTTADALQTLEVRAASTFSALAKGIDDIELTQQSMLLSTAAIKANEVQMQSLDSVIKQFKSNMGSLIYTFSQGILSGLTSLIKGFTSVIGVLVQFKGLIESIVLLFAGKLVFQMVTSVKAITLFGAAIQGLVFLFVNLRQAIIALQLSLVLLTGGAINPVVLALTAVTAAAYAAYKAFEYFTSGVDSASDVIESSNTKIKEAQSTLEKYEQQGRQVTDFLQGLRDKHKELETNTESLRTKILEAKLAFDGLGGTIINLSDDYNTLIAKVTQAKEAIYLQAAASAQALGVQLKLQNTELRQNISDQQPGLIPLSIQAKNAGFTPEIANKIGDAIALGLNDKRTQNQDIDLITRVRALSNARDNIKDSSQLRVFDDILGKLGQQTEGLAKIAQNNIELVKSDRASETNLFDARFAGVATSLLNISNSVTDPVKERLKSANSADALDKVATELENTAKTLEASKGLLDTKVSQFLFGRLPKGSKEAESIDAESSALQRQARDIRTLAEERRTLETERNNARRDQEITALETKARTAPRTETDEIIKRYAQIQADKVTEGIKQIKATVESPTFLEKIEKLPNVTDDAAKKRVIDDYVKEETAKLRLTEANENAAFQTKVQERIGKFSDAVDGQLLPTVDALKNAFEDLESATKLAIARAEQPVKIAEAQRKALDIGQNKFNVTDAQRYRADEQLDRLRAEASKNTLVALQAQQNELPLLIIQLENEKARIAGLAAAQGFTSKDLAGTSEGKRGGEQFKTLQKEYKSATDTLQKYNQTLEENKIKIPEVRAEMEALNGITPPQTFWEVFSESLGVYMDSQNKLAKSNAELGRSFTEIFNTASTGFANVVKNFASGTKSIGASFRDMAKSIIENMLDIASKRTASGLFDLLGGGLGSGGGILGALFGSSTSSSAPISGLGDISISDLPAPGLAQGGIVRGGVPNRDSVRRTLMPGEGVLTKNAVSMLGEDTINTLNTSGNRVTSQSAPQAMNDNNYNQPPMEQKIYLVDNRSQIPGLGPNDVVMIVADNLAKNGTLKKSVRSAVS